MALQAEVSGSAEAVDLCASGRIVEALSAEHADLVRRLGGARRVELRLRLEFAGGTYRGGVETYYVLEHGRRVALMGVRADVRVRSGPTESPHTLPAAT